MATIDKTESCCIYLIKDHKWLMLFRNKKQNDVNHGKWIGIGGKRENGETIEHCAIREAKEETGLVIDQLNLRGTVDFSQETVPSETITVYTSTVFHGNQKECNEGTTKWISEKDILALPLWEGDRIFLKKILQEDKDIFHIQLDYDAEGNLIHSQEVSFMKPIIIGIAGGSASGKTSVSQRIKDEFSDEKSVLIIRQDDYYKDQSDKPMEERLKTNYDHPFAFDNDLLISQIHDLMNGKEIEKPTYDFVAHTRAKTTEHCYPADVIVLEGLFVLEDERLRNMLDIKIFVDTAADIRFIRRLLRDVKERGRSLESVVNQYINTVRVMHDSFIEPSKRYADLIIPEGGHNDVAIDLLVTKISSIIAHADV